MKGIKYVKTFKNFSVTKWHISVLFLLYHLLIRLPRASHCNSLDLIQFINKMRVIDNKN